MSTRGWEGAPIPKPQRPRGRRSLAEILADRARTGADPRDTRTERELMRECCKWLDRRGIRWYHANQPERDRWGFPDLTIAVAKGIFAEAKRPDGSGRVSIEQQAWIDALGDRVIVFCSFGLFVEFVEAWEVRGEH